MYWKIPLKIYNEANSTEHWSKKSKRHRTQRMVLKAYLDKECYLPPLPCIVRLTRYAPRSFDDDNLQMSFKWIKDAIADMMIPGKPLGHADNDPRIKWEYFQEKTKGSEYYFTVEVESVQSSACQSQACAQEAFS